MGRLDELASSLPNSGLLIAPLMRKEAVSSARIEGSQSTVSDALIFEAGGKTAPEDRDDMKEIMNYKRAILDAESKLRDGYSFDLWMLRGLHGELLGDSVRGSDKNPGAFRTHQNHIGPPGSSLEQATYIPPPPEKIPELMDNWLQLWRSDMPSSFVQMALLHGQFEIIHPFMDGNGRVGRLLLPLFLHEKKVLERPVFYLSGRLEARRDAYQSGLRGLNTSPGEWYKWVLFFLETCEQQANETVGTCRALIELHKHTLQKAESLLRSRYAVHFINAIFERPIFALKQLQFAGARPSDLALKRMAQKLIQAGFLEELIPGRRGQPAIYVMRRVLETAENRS